MVSKKLFLILAVGAVLFLQLADCMAAFSEDQQVMHCCGTSVCIPANQSHDCCKAMASAEAPILLVKVRVSLDMPAVAIVDRAPVSESVNFTPLFSAPFEPQQFSPPELYTLYSSFLI
jgi:hypothetical protein